MSYMDGGLAVVGGGIQELSFEEIDAVTGASYWKFLVEVVTWIGRGYTTYEVAQMLSVDVSEVTDVMDTKLGI